MNGERFVLLGLAGTRAGWFRTLSRWSAAAVLPVEFIRCVSADEVRARLSSGRAFSAVVIDAEVTGLDRDLVAEADDAGCAVIVVDGRDGRRDWEALGVAAVLTPPFSRDELLEVLGATTRPVGSALVSDTPRPPARPTVRGSLVAVTGPGGTGASTVAIAVAEGLARGPARPGRGRRPAGPSGRAVLLADLCRRADQAMLHDAQAVVPGLQEMVEAHRTGAPSARAVRELTFEDAARGYRLLVGLRRPRHWTVLRPRAVEASLDSLLRIADVVVADAR